MMATADDSLSIHFQCAVCTEQLEQPKYIGACTHTFCKNCIHQLWVALGRGSTVPCPQCRAECPIPPHGVDGLKDNFTVANIIETYRKKPKDANQANAKCILCPRIASCLCRACDLKLCSVCKGQHDRHKRKHDHNFFGLCSSHGNGLIFFCKPCKQAICGDCTVFNHYLGDHVVTPIRHDLADLRSEILDLSTELNHEVWTHDDEEEIKNLSKLRDTIEQNSKSAEMQATAGVEKAIEEKTDGIKALNAEANDVQRQINNLVATIVKINDRANQLSKDVDELENVKSKIIADVRDRFTKSSETIDQFLRSHATRREEMKTKVQQAGRAAGSSTITIDTESIANLTIISQELMDLVRATRESDTEAVIEDVTRLIGETGVDVGEIGQCLAGMRDNRNTTNQDQKKMVFRQLKKVGHVSYPKDLSRYVVKGLRSLHDGRMASLGESTKLCQGGADEIYFREAVYAKVTSTIENGVHPASDMAVSSPGILVVTREEDPSIRVFSADTGTYRDVKVTHNGKVIDKLQFVATDHLGTIFAVTDYPYHLLVVDLEGNVTESVQLGRHAYRMAFSAVTRILYIAAGNKIRRFHWRKFALQEISSSPPSHGVDGFLCYDVCIGSGGEVLVAGWMDDHKIVVYQVREGDDEKDSVWMKIPYQDDVARKSEYAPHICTSRCILWLGYGNTIEKFELQ